MIDKIDKKEPAKQIDPIDHSGQPPYPDGTVILSGSYGIEIRYPDGFVFKPKQS